MSYSERDGKVPKHTSGPWAVEVFSETEFTIYQTPRVDRQSIAVITSMNEADARLIAAAPELLEVAIGLESDCTEDEFGWGDIRISKENLAQLRAAIRKAKGESGVL